VNYYRIKSTADFERNRPAKPKISFSRFFHYWLGSLLKSILFQILELI